jgi:TPR repeat protein
MKKMILASVYLCLLAVSGIAAGCNVDISQLMYRAEQGDAGAQGALAVEYYKGECVAQNYYEAVKWANKAAMWGDSQGQIVMGMAYLTGDGGVPKSADEAFTWWSRAAEQNVPMGQFLVGYAYLHSIGVAQDYNKSMKWMRRACDNGEPNACRFVRDNLGRR